METTLQIPFDNTYAHLPKGFFTPQSPTAVSNAKLIKFNDALAKELGIASGADMDLAEILAGNEIPEGASPLAQLYAGHQFGQYNPQLGDGRAVLLGEVVDTRGRRRDIQLKGSGPTPYSRTGDGRAWLGPVLREYVVSEAMHALGVPTTRALAAVSTGDPVYREAALPGAVLTRVASSHIRVGTFQVFAHRGQIEDLKTLTDYTIKRHYPEADGAMGLLAAVIQAQAELVATWMSFGFIHGVMNTDNCTISGETIDYGPCAFLDTYQSDKVMSSIDQYGRYAFSNQPKIIVWNMAQFATALIQQMDDKDAAIEQATELVHAMPDQIESAWLRRFGAKIGLGNADINDLPLIEDLLARMQDGRADFTNTFRALNTPNARNQFLDPQAFDAWEVQWRARLGEADPTAIMNAANPVLIPRNHRIEHMIQAAVADDFEPFERLIDAFSQPYDLQDEYVDLQRPPTEQEVVPATFCGT
ncbi:MAG: protein adenylyltransferase SelO [Aliishimia sp.]